MDPELPPSTELASPVDGPQPAEIAPSEEPIASGTLPPPQPRWPDKPWLKIGDERRSDFGRSRVATSRRWHE